MNHLTRWNSFLALDAAGAGTALSVSPTSASRRRSLLLLVLVFWIAVLDLCMPRTNFSILYIAPLVLLAKRGDLRHAWRFAALLVALTFGIYFLKNTLAPADDHPRYFDYRLINRTMVAVMIVVMTRMLEVWRQWRAEQADAELPEELRYQDREISATFALLACIPLAAIIAAVDFFVPANFNLAILYTIPLFVCGWTGSRKLLWTMLAVLLLLTVACYLWGGGAPSDPMIVASLVRNRVLAAAGMVIVTLILHHWMDENSAP